MRMRSPRAFWVPNNSFFSVAPSTTRARGWLALSSGRNWPLLTRMVKASTMAGPTPYTELRRTRPLPSISELPHTTGVTAVTPGRRSSARASSSVSGREVLGRPGGPPRAPFLPGAISITLVPNWVNSASTNWWMPSPMEVSRITAAMPTAMPSRVRKLRRRWATSARADSERKSRQFIVWPGRRPGRAWRRGGRASRRRAHR